MSNRASESRSGGISFLGCLAILFIGLKLGGVIDWSWWWVLAPLWGPVAIVLAIGFLILAVLGPALLVATIFKKCQSRRTRTRPELVRDITAAMRRAR